MQPDHPAAIARQQQQAVQAKWQYIQRNLAEFKLTLVYRRPDILPESPFKLSAWKPDINATD